MALLAGAAPQGPFRRCGGIISWDIERVRCTIAGPTLDTKDLGFVSAFGFAVHGIAGHEGRASLHVIQAALPGQQCGVHRKPLSITAAAQGRLLPLRFGEMRIHVVARGTVALTGLRAIAERVPWLTCTYNGDLFDVPVVLCEAALQAGRRDVVGAIATYLERGGRCALLDAWPDWIGHVLPGVANAQLQFRVAKHNGKPCISLRFGAAMSCDALELTKSMGSKDEADSASIVDGRRNMLVSWSLESQCNRHTHNTHRNL